MEIALTLIEKQAWDILNSLGYEVKEYSDRSPVDPVNVVYVQHIIKRNSGTNPFVADFSIPHAMITIEIDPENWHLQYDVESRDKELREMGWKVLRIPEKIVDKEHIESAIISARLVINRSILW